MERKERNAEGKTSACQLPSFISAMFYKIFKTWKTTNKRTKTKYKNIPNWKNNDVLPLTQATLIKSEFMTLIFVCHFWTSIAKKNVCIVETIII